MNIHKMISNEILAERYFRFVAKLKKKKNNDKIEEMKKKMNMKSYKNFVNENLD